MSILVTILAACAVGAAPAGAANPFTSSSPWNAPVVAGAPLAGDSASTVAKLQALMPTFGPWINTTSFSAPIYTAAADTPRVTVIADTTNTLVKSWFASVPLPADAKPAAGTDGELVLWQPSTDTLWEFWQLHKGIDGAWHASWGGRIDHASTSNGVYAWHYGASASSMSLLGGMITVDEIHAGVINHALAMGLPTTAPTFVAPATYTDGKTVGGIPIGTRLRIDPAVNIPALHLPRTAQIMATAAQRYGIIVRESSGAVTFYAQDPINLGSNPWPSLFGGLSIRTLLANFPWSRLQVVAP